MVKVEFPDGSVREVQPAGYNKPMFNWGRMPLTPQFEIPGHRVLETVDGRYIAVEDMEG